MDINEIRALRESTENAISQSIAEHIANFQREAGVSLNGISVTFTPVHVIGKREPGTLVITTELEVRI